MEATSQIPAPKLLQLRVLGLRLLLDGDVGDGVGVFHMSEKILMGLGQLQIEGVDFLGAEVPDEERDFIGAEAGPGARTEMFGKGANAF
jgi:hypothetical protein